MNFPKSYQVALVLKSYQVALVPKPNQTPTVSQRQACIDYC